MIGSVSSLCSISMVVVSPSFASSLTWSQPITAVSVTAGSHFSSQPSLLVQDLYGNGISSTVVTLSLFTDSACSTAAGDVGIAGDTVTTIGSGSATFSNFKATKTGIYFVKAFASALNSPCSTSTLTVTSGLVSSASFSSQPGGSVAAGDAFTYQPVVYLVDLYGNAVANTSVILSAYSDSSCTISGSGSLRLNVASSGSNGYATFSMVSYNKAQTVYLKASSGIIF